MNRLQKKCVVASAGMHLLLVGIIFVGPGFSSNSKPPTEFVEIINFDPRNLTDNPYDRGGSPNARAAAPVPSTPPPQQIQPQPRPTPPAEKQAETPNEVKPLPEPEKKQPETDSFVESKKPRKPQIITEAVTRPREKKSTTKTPSENDNSAQEKQAADARRTAAQEALRAAARIREGTSSATSIDSDFGNGDGGESSAPYAAWVRSVFDSAWVAPDDTKSDSAVAKARVVIARDGRVISAEIISRSGDPQMDASVQRTLDRVPSVRRPFPETSKDKERSYILRFDLKVKRGLA